MGIVMLVMWWRLCKMSASVISRFLDNKKKSEYRAYFREVKTKDFIKKNNLEVQEHEEGLWIEIHLSEVVDDN